MEDEKIAPIPLRSKQIGQSLIQHAVEVITENKHEILSTWYKGFGEADVDLYIWSDKKKNIIKQQINFYGQVVEWNIVEGLKTGVFLDHDISEDSGFIKYDFEKQNLNISQAVDIIKNMENLSETVKRELIFNFEEEPTIKNMNPKDFIKKYSLYAKELRSRSILISIKKNFLKYLSPF